MPELGISTEKVGFLIEKARQFDVKEEISDPDSGSNAADDDMIDVLQDNGQDPVVGEITGFINALSEDERVDLVALMRLGRGDATIDEWEDLRNEAAGQRDRHTARYLLGEPMLGDFLAQGLDEFGLTWDEERTTAIPPASASGKRTSAIDDDGAELVAFLHRKMRLRGVRERELRGDIVNARTRRQPLRNVRLRCRQ